MTCTNPVCAYSRDLAKSAGNAAIAGECETCTRARIRAAMGLRP